MGKLAKALTASAGNAGGTLGYVEDVFSTFVYTGTGSARAINNGIDLDGEGGTVWVKHRTGTNNHEIYDTARGAGKVLYPDLNLAEGSGGRVDGFNSNGFDLTSGASANQSGQDYVSWSFRKAEKFFDIQTWSGNDSANRQISHNLGSVPGMMIVKQLTDQYAWQVYHVSNGNTKFMEFGNFRLQTSSAVWNDTTPTDSVFTVGSEYGVNQSGKTYVGYLFASDAGGFGDAGDESIVKCGGYTADASNAYPVTVGFEPQFVIIRRADATGGNWMMLDTMRGFTADAAGQEFLYTNLSNAEASDSGAYLTSTGFVGSNQSGSNGAAYIYIAIRRPMKTPTAGTEVFAMDTADGTPLPQYESGFVTDFEFNRTTDAAYTAISSRLTGSEYMRTNDTSTAGNDNDVTWDFMNGWSKGAWTLAIQYSWMFKRASGFFDVVAYTGTGSATSFNHNLGVTPLLQIIKRRNGVSSWYVNDYALSATSRGFLNAGNNFASSGTEWSGSNATTFSVYSGGLANINTSGATYINYLFATVAGVSKVGSYTGNAGYAVNVDCGFSAGARFILIKRTDSTGDWYYWDSARGIVAGNDPYLLLNETNAEVTNTDYVDPLSSGFTVTSSAPAGLNASGGRYLFLAIA